MYEIEHYIVSAADGLVDRCYAVNDEVADIARPDVGTVREAGQTNERIKLRWLRIDEHLARKASAELRNADAAGLADDIVVIRESQNGRRREYLHRIGIRQQYLPGVNARCILKHADHGRVIVTQLVKL